jgi:hypothetical protein
VPGARDARERLGADAASVGNPLPSMIAYLDSARSLPDRANVPRTVSAYPDTGNQSGQRY